MSETEVKTDAPTAEEIKGTKRTAEVSTFYHFKHTVGEILRKTKLFTRKFHVREISLFHRYLKNPFSRIAKK